MKLYWRHHLKQICLIFHEEITWKPYDKSYVNYIVSGDKSNRYKISYPY